MDPTPSDIDEVVTAVDPHVLAAFAVIGDAAESRDLRAWLSGLRAHLSGPTDPANADA